MSEPTKKDDHTDLLHSPRRAEHMMELEEHLHAAAGLARAIWIAVQNPDLGLDERDCAALQQLTCALADHSSAALYGFYVKGENGK